MSIGVDSAALDMATDIERALAAFVKDAVAEEARRLTRAGARVLVLPVANIGIVIEENEEGSRQRLVVNRVELATSFDTSAITGIMLSAPAPVPAHLIEPERGDLVLYFVVLQTASPIALLAGVVVEPSAHPDNDLSTWRFVNNKMQATTHVVAFDEG